MKKLFVCELRKTWGTKWILLPATLLLVLVAWLVVMESNHFRDLFNGVVSRANEETRPYWGQAISEEFRAIATEKAIEYGAEDVDGYLSADRVTQEYGMGSEEWQRCMLWRSFAMDPTLEEEQAQQELLLENFNRLLEEGRYSESFYRHMTRGYQNPAVYEIGPGSTAWRYWLDTESYASLIVGIAVIGLTLLIVGNVFSGEEGGGLREVSLATPRRRQWIAAKILVSLFSGAFIAFSLNFGLLVFYGIIYGFQGWNVSALTYTAGGSVYGLLYRPVTCLELACLRMMMFLLCGAFMGGLTAACSALVRKTLPASGLALALCAGMESLLYIEGVLRQRLTVMGDPLSTGLDWGMLESALTTPVRAFLNTEVLTSFMPGLTSSYSNVLMHNNVITPDLCAVFVGLTVVGIALCGAVCFTYQRQR